MLQKFYFLQKTTKKRSPHFFGFFHQHRTLICTYCTFLRPMRRHEALPIDLRQGLSPNWGLGGEAPGKFLRFYVNFRLREHTCQRHCYKKAYFFANRLEAKCPLPFHPHIFWFFPPTPNVNLYVLYIFAANEAA